MVVSQDAIAESEDRSTRKGQKKRFMKKGSVSLRHTDIILSIFFNQRPSGKLSFHPMLKNRIPISWAISQNPYEISSVTQSPEEKLLEPKNWCFGRCFFSKSNGSSSSSAAPTPSFPDYSSIHQRLSNALEVISPFGQKGTPLLMLEKNRFTTECNDAKRSGVHWICGRPHTLQNYDDDEQYHWLLCKCLFPKTSKSVSLIFSVEESLILKLTYLRLLALLNL